MIRHPPRSHLTYTLFPHATLFRSLGNRVRVCNRAGQATFRPTDSLSFTGGIRYTHDEKRGNNYGFQFATPDYDGPVEGTWQRVTYRLAADYLFTPDVMVYVSYARAYKTGGVKQAINPILTHAVYDHE